MLTFLLTAIFYVGLFVILLVAALKWLVLTNSGKPVAIESTTRRNAVDGPPASLAQYVTTLVQSALRTNGINATFDCQKCSIGRSLPIVSNIKTHAGNGELKFEFDFDYDGGAEIDFSSCVPIPYPYEGFASLPISVHVDSLKLQGRLQVVWLASDLSGPVEPQDAGPAAQKKEHTFRINFMEAPFFSVNLGATFGSRVRLVNNHKVMQIVRHFLVKGIHSMTAPHFKEISITVGGRT